MAYRRRTTWIKVRTGDINMPMGYNRYGRYGRKLRRRLIKRKRGGSRFSRGYSKSQRAKRAKFSRTNVGEPIGATSCKRFTARDTNPTAYNTRELYTANISIIGRNGSTAFDDIDQRERDVVNFRGIRMHFHLQNLGFNPMHVHIAVLHNKTTDGVAPTTENFFRGSGSTRGLDFSTALNSTDLSTRGINTDKYVILMHKRMFVPGRNEPLEVGVPPTFPDQWSGRSYRTIKKYLKLKRQIRYDGAGTQNQQPIVGNIWLVWWCDNFMQATGTESAPGVLSMADRHVIYYKEPKT
jgi:hypothetical protein